MIPIRRSPATKRNSEVVERPAGELSNRQWLSESSIRRGVILLGGSTVADFRLRVAQSHLRSDLTPSCWSMAGILLDDETFASVPFTFTDPSAVPRRNGVQICQMTDYEDPRIIPNIAVVEFATGADAIRRSIELIATERSIVDLPSLLVAWLAFVWGAGQSTNPLLQEQGIPSAVFVETAYAIAGVELTPGLSAASTCPEAIWQAAVWWQEFFEAATGTADEKRAVPVVPHGEFVLRQPAAAVTDLPRPAPESPPGAASKASRPKPRRGAKGIRKSPR